MVKFLQEVCKISIILEQTYRLRQNNRTTWWIERPSKSDNRKAKTSWTEMKGSSCCPTSTTTYYYPRLQL